MAQDAFKFPDEKGLEGEGKDKDKNEELEIVIEGEDAPVEVEVKDDTPPEDRGREPMKEAPQEVTEEELNRYSKQPKLRDRLAHLGKGYHEERRAKEAATRERDEAIKITQAILAENERLKSNAGTSEKVIIEQAKSVATKELDEAKRKFKVAYEAGDAEAVTQAQEELTAAKIKHERVSNYQPRALQPAQDEVKHVPAPQKPASGAPVDEKAVAWQTKNTWFNKDREMTSLALAVHEGLVEEGVDPQSDAYYARIDSRMREKFPEKFPGSSGGTEKPRRSVVAPATRSSSTPKKVVLTASAVALAKRLGVPLELYAKKVAEGLRADNG